MKKTITASIAVLLSTLTFGQQVISGDYDYGLKLSYDSSTKRLTGYFENYSGWDKQTKSPRFSCIFYIKGVVTGQEFQVHTYYPLDKADDLILGTIEIVNSRKVRIKLPEEHGGCWNVQHFTDEPVEFRLEKSQRWTQIRYVDVDKTHFHSGKSDGNRLKSYLVKGDLVCLEKVEPGWAYCTYIGKKITKGWLKLSDLNKQ